MTLGARRRYVGTTWYIQQHEDGRCDVLKRGREVLSDVPYLKARRYLRQNRSRSDKAWVVAPDGYRTLI